MSRSGSGFDQRVPVRTSENPTGSDSLLSGENPRRVVTLTQPTIAKQPLMMADQIKKAIEILSDLAKRDREHDSIMMHGDDQPGPSASSGSRNSGQRCNPRF